jgi:membrane protease YdiL (CAAX protease family)
MTSRQGARWAAVVAAMLWPTLMVEIYWVGLSGGQAGANPMQQLAYVLGKTAQFAFPVVFVWWLKDDWNISAGRPWAGVGLGLAFAALVGGAILALYYGVFATSPLLSRTPGQVHGILVKFGVDSLSRYLMLSAFLVIAHSLLEEYYWRWFVFGQLRRLIPPAAAIVISSLGFMAHHVVLLNSFLPGRLLWGVLPFSFAVAVGGAFWAWLYQRSGSLLGPWLSHLAIDAAVFVIGWDLFQRGG